MKFEVSMNKKESIVDMVSGRKGFYIEYTPIPKKYWFSFQEHNKTYKPCTILGFRHIPSAMSLPERLYYFIEIDGEQKEVDHSLIILTSNEDNMK